MIKIVHKLLSLVVQGTLDPKSHIKPETLHQSLALKDNVTTSSRLLMFRLEAPTPPNPKSLRTEDQVL